MRNNLSTSLVLAVLAVFCFSLPPPALAQQSAQELAKTVANPVASLISLPFQGNFDLNYKGAIIDGGYKFLINVQPVVPITLTKNWNLISRTILPVGQQANVFGIDSTQTGLGDTLQSFFLSPASPSKGLGLIWGAGPVFLLPTGTNDLLGGGKWGIGPTIVVVKQTGPWTIGCLANQIWSFAGKEDRSDVDSLFIQPFLSRAYKAGFSWSVNTEFTQNWEADVALGSINFTVAQILPVFGQLVQVSLGPKFWYGSEAAVRARWGVRLNLSFLFPKK